MPFLVVGAGFLIFSSQNREGKKGASQGVQSIFDYGKFEELAKKRPNGENYLNFIRENEQMLFDGDPSNDADAYITMGFNLHVLGDDTSAIWAYEEGLRLSPDNSYGLNNIATSYMELGEYEKAEGAYRKLSKVLSGDSSAVINHAEVYGIVNPSDKKGFWDIIERGISVAAGDNLASILTYAGGYFRDSGDKEKAEEYFKKLVEFFPNNELYKSELEDLRK